MRALAVCQELLSKSLRKMHAKRLKALWFAVHCLLEGGRLSLTALGRAARGGGHEKHLIKRIDRLVGNTRLWLERPAVYQALATLLVAGNDRPVILLDWTPWREGFHALTASVPVGGKSLPIYGEVHHEKHQGSHAVHCAFLDQLAGILPRGAVPIIVADSGFKNNWMDKVIDLGWDYIVRVRGNVCFLDADAHAWEPVQRLHERPLRKPRDLGEILLGKCEPRARRVVGYYKPPRKRKQSRSWRRKPGADKRRGHANNRSTNDEKYRKAAKEPWILATSLTCSAKEVVRIYRARMQTEETYRAFKSHRFGWSFKDSNSTTAPRLEILLLIAALAMVVVTAVGWLAEHCGLHRRYQANTAKKRTLSWFFLGFRICNRQDFVPRADGIRETLVQLPQLVKTYAPGAA